VFFFLVSLCWSSYTFNRQLFAQKKDDRGRRQSFFVWFNTVSQSLWTSQNEPKGIKDWGISSFWPDVKLQHISKTLALRWHYGISTHQCELTKGLSIRQCSFPPQPFTYPFFLPTDHSRLEICWFSQEKSPIQSWLACLIFSGWTHKVKDWKQRHYLLEEFMQVSPNLEVNRHRVTADGPALSSTPSGR